MKTISKGLAKGAIATVAAGAMAMASATPAMARDRDRHDGISAGDVIAGALVIGGIAAIASSIGNNRGYNGTYGGPYYGDKYRYDNRYYNGYSRYGDPRTAVEQCVNAATRGANRYGYGRGARVTDIRDVDAKRDGYRVKGTIIVNERNGGWGRDYNYRYSGRNYDSGRFTCEVRYGRVVDLDYSGIRGL
jgi:hypothetical protein